ncbi:methyltransferase family protein [Raoultella sp. BIGb0138]|uniref:O-methyltransferase n=1 Tax=Raoultella sp. BIGb0138 TaxID=2485115 RepID=UPI00104ABC12|nr:class I SAM-dependent methyltransferase [Raoultella sp. BIGb0138]TCW06424.1 methyltransferase family protein [Raoultella sp. BIGb0138]
MSTTLTAAPLAALLERLFKQADSAASTSLSGLSRADRERMMSSKTEYLALYGQLKDLWLPVTRETGALLYMLARSARAQHIVEFGTSFGISALHLAAALKDNGGGLLITSEFEPGKVAKARAHLQEAGLDALVEVREGDALQTLADNLPETIDMVLLDGAKALYPDILALLESRLRPSATIVADNADYSAEYLNYVRNPQNGYLSVPFADDVEISLRLG